MWIFSTKNSAQKGQPWPRKRRSKDENQLSPLRGQGCPCLLWKNLQQFVNLRLPLIVEPVSDFFYKNASKML